MNEYKHNGANFGCIVGRYGNGSGRDSFLSMETLIGWKPMTGEIIFTAPLTAMHTVSGSAPTRPMIMSPSVCKARTETAAIPAI
ncbi:MAG: hypothetical protein V8S96_02555 [Lachnospiraceae bacterium]